MQRNKSFEGICEIIFESEILLFNVKYIAEYYIYDFGKNIKNY